MHHGILLSHKEKQNYVIYMKIDGTGNLHAERDKTSSKDKTLNVLDHLCILDLKKKNEKEKRRRRRKSKKKKKRERGKGKRKKKKEGKGDMNVYGGLSEEG
jgi:ribosomal protein L19E